MPARADLALASPGQGFCRSGGRVIFLQWVGKEGGRSRIKAASHALAFVDWELRPCVKFGKSFSVSLWDSLSLSRKAHFAQRGGSVAGVADGSCEAKKTLKGI